MNNNLSIPIILNLLIVLFSSNLNSQSTKELFSSNGLTIISNSSDDTGRIFESTSFYSKDTIIDTLVYLEYHSKRCYSTFLRVEDKRVYQRNLTWDEEETLLYDFDSVVGDTISLTTFFSPSGFLTFDYYVTDRKVVRLLDNRDRIRITLESDNVAGQIVWIEGIGDIRGVQCVKDEQGSVYFNNISEDDCDRRSCKDITVKIELSSIDNSVVLINRSMNYDEIEWNMGDGTTYLDNEISHTYGEKKCREITLTVRNTCGEERQESIPFGYCADSLWVVQSKIEFKAFSMVNELEGWAVTRDSIYKTTDGSINWIAQKSISTDTTMGFLDIYINDHGYGIASVTSSLETDLVVTTDGGQTWKEIEIPEVRFSIWKVRINSNGEIVVASSIRTFRSNDFGDTWTETRLTSGNNYSTDLYQNDDGLVVVTTSETRDIDRSFIHVSQDGGETYRKFSFDYVYQFNGISFVNDIGYVAGIDGIWQTKDKGLSWNQVSFYSDFRWFQDVHFTDLNNGIAITRDKVYRTSDAGNSWQLEYCQNKSQFESLEVIGDKEFILGSLGISKYSPEEVFDCTTSNTEFPNLNLTKIYPNPVYQELYVSNRNIQFSRALVYDLNGKILITKQVLETDFVINLDAISQGIYILNLETVDGKLETYKIVKQ